MRKMFKQPIVLLFLAIIASLLTVNVFFAQDNPSTRAPLSPEYP